ncbi:hypothetical protein BRD17_04525 [Halobacteriales archaeon SW_7_68_16]|nr:MAG: hypothetical protein BRD17_04525 [Halobacteriales archaeon SW_7_68_16]
MANYVVRMEAGWLVRDVDETDDAIGVAVSEAGRRLNEADLEYVDIDVGGVGCPACGEPFDAAFVAAGTALVGLAVEMTALGAESEEHAARIVKSEVGAAFPDTPLEVIEVLETDDGDTEEPATADSN